MLFSRKNHDSSKRSPKGKPQTSETPFEARRRMLAEQEAALRAEAEKHKRFIENAPKIAAERQKEQREVFLRNAAHTGQRAPHGALQLPDSRYLNNDVALHSPRSRRRERQKGKWLFFFLVLLLMAAAFWAWQMLAHPAF